MPDPLPTNPYIGQIEIFAFNFAPSGWAICAGQLLSIVQNQQLFSLLGTTFGGNGLTNFALPDLRGCTPIGQGKGPGLTPRPMGSPVGGEEQHSVLITETPFHSHSMRGRNLVSTDGNSYIPDNTMVLAQAVAEDKDGNPLKIDVYHDQTPDPPDQPPKLPPYVQLGEAAISSVGGGQPHENMMPYLTLTVCIALSGDTPPRN
jgi:microcystin-dependent protein